MALRESPQWGWQNFYLVHHPAGIHGENFLQTLSVKTKPGVSFILLKAAKGRQVYARARLLLLNILPTGKPKQQQVTKSIINEQKEQITLT